MENKINVSDFDYLIPKGQKIIGVISEGYDIHEFHFKNKEGFYSFIESLLFSLNKESVLYESPFGGEGDIVSSKVKGIKE